jgi:tetratricopeptide (TPR) repeat protein
MSNPEYSNKYVPLDRSETGISSTSPSIVLAGSAIIIVSILLAYYPSLQGGFILDDGILLTDNYLIKASDGLYRFWFTTQASEYYPVTNTLFWIEWRIWGMNPTGYRAVNLALHIIDTLLIWFILRKLSIPGAFLAAMIFAVHPVNVESVVWISQLRNVLTLFFFLLSIWCYLKADMPTASVGMAPPRSHGGPWERVTSPWSLAPSPRPLFYWLSLSLFILALLSKGSSAVLPALLLGIIWWRRGVKKWDILRIVPFFLISVLSTGVNIWFQTHGSGGAIRNAGFAERLLGAGSVVWFYLFKAILPYNLMFVYPQWQIRVGNPLWWLPLMAALAVTAVLWQYRKGWSRSFLFAWGFFCVALLPVMGFTDVGFFQYSLVADHYQHIAIIGVIALAAAGISTWIQRARAKARQSAITLAAMAAGTLIIMTWQQSGLYRDALTIYQATLKKNPGCAMVHNNLGVALIDAGRPQDAIDHFRQALVLMPDDSEAHNNMGLFLINEGRLPEAIEHFRKAIKFKPRFTEVYNNLGRAWLKSGNIQKAIINFEKAISIDPYYSPAYYNMGRALDQTDRLQGAIENYEKALSLNSDYISAHNNLGIVLMMTGRHQDAIDHFKQALRLAPKDAEVYKNLGMAMAAAGRTHEAIKLFEQALALKPDLAEAHYQLGLVLADLGRKYDAIEHFEQTLRFDTDHPEVQYNLGLTLVNTGRVREAIEYFIQVIKLKPDHIDAYSNLMLAYAKLDQSAEAVATAQKAVEIARSKEQWKQAKKIKDWLNSYRAGQEILPSTTPSSKSAFPEP